MNQMPPTDDAPDVRQLRDRELPESPFPGGSGQDLRVYLTPEVYEELQAHAAEDTTVEICGVMVGTWARDAGGPFVQVTDAIRGEAARNKFAEVTFTHDTWARINAEMDKRFADRAIVGWYHTHPDFGVFLSDRDRFIQEHFFSGAGQIALVIDPIRRTVGAFTWRDGKPTLCPHFWAGDRVIPGTAAGEEAPRARAAGPAAPARSPAAAPAEPSVRPWATQALAYLAVFLLGHLIASFRSSWEQARLVEGVVAHYGLWQGLRPGLHQGLAALGGRLDALTRQVNGLSADQLVRQQGQKGARDDVKRWDQVRRDLADATTLVAELDRLYSLSPAESAAVENLVMDRIRSVSDPRTDAGAGRPPSTAAPAGASRAPDAKPAEPRPNAPSK